MQKTNPDDFINPQAELTTIDQTTNAIGQFGGLTKREYFSTLILAGLLSDSMTVTAFRTVCAERNESQQDLAAKCAIRYADALIAELNK